MGCGASSTDNAEKDKKQMEDDYDQAVLEVKRNRDRLKKYINRLEADNEKQVQIARKLAKEGKMDRAKLVLRLKKSREAMITKTDNMLYNLQEQLNNLESAKITREFADNIKKSNEVLKTMNEQLTPEMVEQLMDEFAEQKEKMDEVQELLGQTMDPTLEAEAEEEYEKLCAMLDAEEEEGEAQEDGEPEPEEEKPKKQRVAALA